jgi:hypothetical protein
MYKLGSRIIDADKNAYTFVLSQEHFVIRFWGSPTEADAYLEPGVELWAEQLKHQ